MNFEEYMDELEKLEGEAEIFVETNSSTYRIYDLSWEDDDYEEGMYMCSDLGNFAYCGLSGLGKDLYNKIDNRGEKIMSVDTE